MVWPQSPWGFVASAAAGSMKFGIALPNSANENLHNSAKENAQGLDSQGLVK